MADNGVLNLEQVATAADAARDGWQHSANATRDAARSVEQVATTVRVVAEGAAASGPASGVADSATQPGDLSLELKPPDVSQAVAQLDAYRQAGAAAGSAAARGFQRVSRSVETASESVQSGRQSVAAFGATAAQLRLPNFRRPAADVERLGRSARDAGANITSSAEAAGAALLEIADSVASIDAKIQDAYVDVGAATLKAAEGFQSAADGALTLARGIAFVTSSSERGFEETAQKIGHVSAALDVFRGGIQTIKGLSDGMRALQTAARAASASQTALATANTAVTTTAGTARTAMTALQVALGPVGLAVLALGAAVAGVAAAWKFFSTPAQEPVRQTASALEDVRNLLDDIGQRADLRELQSQFALDESALGRPATARDRLTAIEQRRRATQQELNRIAQNFGSGTLALARPDRPALHRLQQGARSENASEAQRHLAILQLIQETQRNDLEAKREALDVLKQQNQVLRDNREQTVEEWKAARSALEVARQARQEAEQRAQARRDDFAERIGALNPEQVAQVRRIQQIRDAGGSVWKSDALLLEEFGVTDQFARDIRRRTGLAAGARGFERSFGLDVDEGVSEAQSRVIREERRVQAVESRITGQLHQAGPSVAPGEDPLAVFVQQLTQQIEANRNQQRQHLSQIADTIERLIDHSNLLSQLEDRLQVLEQQRKLNEV